MSDFDLTQYKRDRLREVLARTESLFLAGFTFSGTRVRIDARSVVFYQSLNDLGAALTSTTIPAADPLDAPVAVALGNIGAFLGAVKAYLRQLHADEAVLIAGIRNGADRAAVDLVQDLRQPA